MRERSEAALGALACAALLAAASPAAAQGGVAERLNLDRLQLGTIGVSAGGVWPSRVEPTTAYAIHADYGEIAPRWRIVLTATYWGSEFEDDVVDELEAVWREATIDPSGDDTVRVGRIRLSDIALEVDARWTPLRRGAIRPFVGGGIGVHVLNAENRLIAGTFVESALDMIASGITVLGGLETAPVAGVGIGVQGRYTLISNTRFFTLRAGASYTFPQPRSAP